MQVLCFCSCSISLSVPLSLSLCISPYHTCCHCHAHTHTQNRQLKSPWVRQLFDCSCSALESLGLGHDFSFVTSQRQSLCTRVVESDVERGRGGGGYGSCMKLLRVFMVDGWRPRRLQSVDLCLFKLFSTKKLLKKGKGRGRKVEQNKSNSNISKHLPSPSSGSPAFAFAFAFAFAPLQLDSIKCAPPRCHTSLPPITVDCPGQPFDSRQPLG